MSRRDTLPAAYFDKLYETSADPWEFETSDYERQKYAATLAILRPRAYSQALEVGCSIGVLTAQLARHCRSLLAIDGSEVALRRAREREGLANVRFERRMVPGGFPDGQFDLIILSEVLYYLAAADLSILAARSAEALTADGEIILCHWLGDTDYPLEGRVASDLFAREVASRLPQRQIVRDEIYRLERLSV